MSDVLNSLHSFLTSESAPDLLESTLVGRKDLVDRLEELVIESATSGNKLQRLIIGPRGSGKTHVLKVLHNRISNKEKFKDKLKIAYLIEDEYGVATFLDWIIRLLRSFIRWYPESAEYLNNEIEKLKKVPVADQEKVAVSILLKYIQGKTVLVIVENIGNIFDKKKGFGKKGQQKFRDLIQQYPYFTIMASNQALFQDIQKEDMPFHNFFKVIHLKKLSFDETIGFLKTIADYDKKYKVTEFIDTSKGRGQIRAIYDLIGGNHRLLVTFYQFLNTDFKHKLSANFIKIINDLTPFYQNLMDALPAQQQKIIQYLCQERKPANVKNISENCFSKENIISKQLSNLLRLKYVDAIKSGRETFYELAEPLLRIYNEVNENRSGPIRLFIDFLGNLYSVEEIKRKYMECHILAKDALDKTTSEYFQEQFYYKEALKNYFPDEYKVLKIEEFERSSKDHQIKTYLEELEKSKAYPELLEFTSKIKAKERYLVSKEAPAFGKTGEISRAIERATALLEKNAEDIDALLLLAETLRMEGQYEESNNNYKKILEINSSNDEALIGLGKNLFFQKKLDDSEQIFSKILSKDNSNVVALEYMGRINAIKKHHQQASNYFRRLTEEHPDYPEGWSLLGQTFESFGNKQKAKELYHKAIGLDKNNAHANFVLGTYEFNQGDYKQAHYYLKKFTDVRPENSQGWKLLGRTQERLEKFNEAKDSYLKAVEFDENNAEAIQALGTLLGNQGDSKQAYIYFKKLTEILPDYSIGWSLLGKSLEYMQKLDETKNCYLKAIELDEKNEVAIKDLGILLYNQGKYNQACEYFKKLTEILPEYSIGWWLLGRSLEIMQKVKEAQNCYLKAIELDEENTEAIQDLGILIGNQGDIKQAYRYFKKLTEILPDYSGGWTQLGGSLEGMQKLDESINCYLKAIELDKKNIEAIQNLGILLNNQGKKKLACEYFKKLTEILPKYSRGWSLLGHSLRNLQKVDEARECFLRSIELDEKNVEAIKDMRIIMGELGDIKQTYMYCKRFTELEPEDAKGWSFLGASEVKLNKNEEAKKSFLEAISINNKEIESIWGLGLLLFKEENYQQAYNYFLKITELQPQYSEGWRFKGIVEKLIGNIKDAKASLLKAIELDNNTLACKYLSMLLCKERNFKEALHYIEIALSQDPENSSTLNIKGEIYRLSNQFGKAIQIYLQAIKINPKSFHPYFNIVSCQLGLNNIDEALSQFHEALDIAKGLKLSNQLIKNIEENLTTLFINVSVENIPTYLDNVLKLIKKHDYFDQFYKSIPETIFELLKQNEKIDTDRFEFIESLLKDRLKENEEMEVPLKFLNIGIRYLKKNEKNVLLQLTKEERITFNKFVLDQMN